MKPNHDTVRIAAQALAMAPSRDALLEPWGLTYADVKAANIGLYEQAFLIPFHDIGGHLVGAKKRHLGASDDAIGRGRG